MLPGDSKKQQARYRCSSCASGAPPHLHHLLKDLVLGALEGRPHRASLGGFRAGVAAAAASLPTTFSLAIRLRWFPLFTWG